jgi:hypothetical protein
VLDRHGAMLISVFIERCQAELAFAARKTSAADLITTGNMEPETERTASYSWGPGFKSSFGDRLS